MPAAIRSMTDWIVPDWPAPASVRALQTLRSGGASEGPYASLNLGAHVGDAARAVAANRARLRRQAGLPGEPHWLEQVHGTDVVTLPDDASVHRADAAVARTPGQICAVMTADCLPVLLCGVNGGEVAAVHCGWRGLCAGVLENCLAAMQTPPQRLLAWLGPAIGPDAFEVGAEVRDAFLARDGGCESAFRPARRRKFLADLYALARRRLHRAGVERIHGGGLCTVGEPGRFFSYRRDGRCGRMAALIWLASSG